MFGKRRVILLLLWVWVFAFPLSATSFALRGLEKGAQVRDMELVGINEDGGKLSFFSGEKGLIVIYWATGSSPSREILAFAEKELRRYEEHGVKLLAVNADRQEMRKEDLALVRTRASEMALSFPVMLDAGLEGYNNIGIITVPTTLILDRDLTIVDVYPGFPSVARDDIPDRIDAFLGIARGKRAEKSQYLLDHKPKNHALQYYNLGKTMFSFARSPSGGLKSVPENAIERLDESIRRDPDFFRPYLLKTIIFDMAGDEGRRDAVLAELARKDFQEVYERRILGFGYLYLGMDNVASDFFLTLSSQIPDDPGVLFGQAVVAARGKDTDTARKALEALGKVPETAEALGFDPAALFTDTGELPPGAEGEIKTYLETLLGIREKSMGSLRNDAPVLPAGSSLPPQEASSPPTGTSNPPPGAKPPPTGTSLPPPEAKPPPTGVSPPSPPEGR
jgi:peroxiredoxin